MGSKVNLSCYNIPGVERSIQYTKLPVFESTDISQQGLC